MISMTRNTFYKLLASLVFMVSMQFGNAQDPYYSQYFNAPLYYNPGMVGLNSGLKVRLMYRNQWPQYNDDLKSYNFSMDVAERFMPGAGGLGIIFNTNKEGDGLIKKNLVGALASARVRINRNMVSQLGFMVAYVQKQIDDDEFIWGDQLDNRHGLLHPQSSFGGFTNQFVYYPDVSLGGVVNYEKEYVSMTFGAAVHHLLKPNESFYDLDTRVPRKYVLHADFVIFQKSNPRKGFRFNPGILYENQAGFNTFTLGSNISKSVMYTGMWYRNKQSQIYNYQSVILMAGVNIPMVNKYARMKIQYSYDISVTEMKGTGGTHEITLRFEFDQIHLVKSKSAFANEYPIIYDPVVF
jgi:type IX secretion system PorP/SprF family membrane protein